MADSDASTWPLPFSRDLVRVEAYSGENEDIDNLAALISPPEEQPKLLEILEHGPLRAGAEQYEELGPNNLQIYLQGEWERALEILTRMVENRQAVNGAVNTEANPMDIKGAHPELVLLLRAHAYFDITRQGNIARALAYYRVFIDAIYPQGIDIGSPFVDALLSSIRASATTGAPMSGDNDFSDKMETHRSVNDYLKVYFPEFRNEVEEGSRRVGGLFGEKRGTVVRCFACQREFDDYNKTKLRHHQMLNPAGRQALCQASTQYIRQQILAAEQDSSSSSGGGAAGSSTSISGLGADDGAAAPSTSGLGADDADDGAAPPIDPAPDDDHRNEVGAAAPPTDSVPDDGHHNEAGAAAPTAADDPGV